MELILFLSCYILEMCDSGFSFFLQVLSTLYHFPDFLRKQKLLTENK